MFPDHACRNFRRQINKVGKKYPGFKDFGQRCANAMKKIIMESGEDYEYFNNLVDLKTDHYCGIHSRCKNPDKCKFTSLIDDEDAKAAFLVHFITK